MSVEIGKKTKLTGCAAQGTAHPTYSVTQTSAWPPPCEARARSPLGAAPLGHEGQGGLEDLLQPVGSRSEAGAVRDGFHFDDQLGYGIAAIELDAVLGDLGRIRHDFFHEAAIGSPPAPPSVVAQPIPISLPDCPLCLFPRCTHHYFARVSAARKVGVDSLEVARGPVAEEIPAFFTNLIRFSLYEDIILKRYYSFLWRRSWGSRMGPTRRLVTSMR